MVTEYVVVIEQEGDASGAYVPDLPGCVAAGCSRDEVVELIADAIPLHIQSLREHGEPIPPPTAMGSTSQGLVDRTTLAGYLNLQGSSPW